MRDNEPAARHSGARRAQCDELLPLGHTRWQRRDACGPVQIQKSSLVANSATYGGGAFLSTSSTPNDAIDCSTLPPNLRPFYPVHFDQCILTDNRCGPASAGAGPAVFWNQPYTLDVTCADSGEAAPVSESSECSLGDAAQQTYCHMCMRIAGCQDWDRNRAMNASELPDYSIVESQTRAPDAAREGSLVLLPVFRMRSAPSLTSAAVARMNPALAPQAPEASGKSDRSPPQERLLTAAISELNVGAAVANVQAGGGLASGGVSLLPTVRSISNYAAGTTFNVSVLMLDAYHRLVNTDVLLATRPGVSPQRATIRAAGPNVLLSGVQTQPFTVGAANLTGLSLVAEPGSYELVLESEGLDSASIQVVVRDCVPGEVFSGNRCVVCSNGTFSLSTAPAATTCRACPPQAVCYGSSAFVPTTGSYHASLLSLNLYRYVGAAGRPLPMYRRIVRQSTCGRSF